MTKIGLVKMGKSGTCLKLDCAYPLRLKKIKSQNSSPFSRGFLQTEDL